MTGQETGMTNEPRWWDLYDNIGGQSDWIPRTDAGRALNRDLDDWSGINSGDNVTGFAPNAWARAIRRVEVEAAAPPEPPLPPTADDEGDVWDGVSDLREHLQGMRWASNGHPIDPGLIDICIEQIQRQARAEAAPPEPPLDVPAMTETLRFLYHADEPCDKPDEHRHEYIAAGIVGQYPRIRGQRRG